eukprot:3101281-Prymnesium_polylepis.2
MAACGLTQRVCFGPRSALVDDELRAQCKYWSIPFRDPPTKPKEKPDAANTRQILIRADVKVRARTVLPGERAQWRHASGSTDRPCGLRVACMQAAETAYYTKMKTAYQDFQNWFYHSPLREADRP